MRLAFLQLMILLALFACCRKAPLPLHKTKSETPKSVLVVVVGDHTVDDVLRQLDTSSLRTSTNLDDQEQAMLVIIAQDATTGAMPVHAELVKQLQVNNAEHFLWLMTNTAKIKDQELLELEMLEANELLNHSGLPGDDIPFAFDSENAPVDSTFGFPQGWDALNEYLTKSQLVPSSADKDSDKTADDDTHS